MDSYKTTGTISASSISANSTTDKKFWSCGDVDCYFMSYMDGQASELEHALAKKHINVCPRCKEDFAVYETIRFTLSEDSNQASHNAPEGFEAAVMQRVLKLSENTNVTRQFEHSLQMVLAVVAGFVGVFGAVYFEQLSVLLHPGSLFANPLLESLLLAVESLRMDSLALLTRLNTSFGEVALALFELLAQAQLVILLIFVLLTSLQIVVYRFGKV